MTKKKNVVGISSSRSQKNLKFLPQPSSYNWPGFHRLPSWMKPVGRAERRKMDQISQYVQNLQVKKMMVFWLVTRCGEVVWYQHFRGPSGLLLH